MIRSIRDVSRMSGTKPGLMPWILWTPFGSPDSTADSAASTAIIWTLGLRSFSTWPTPVMVPPVPTPETKKSTWPSVSAQTSSAVVLRWISTLAWFSNCRARIAPGVLATISSALARAPPMPSGPGVSTSSAPKARSTARRSFEKVSGSAMITLYPRAAPTQASAIPVLPEVASTMVPPGLSEPSASAASTIATPMRSFTDFAGL